MKKLIEYTKILRSKNAGPLYITFDLIFHNREDMEYVAQRLKKEVIAAAYNADADKVEIISYAVVNSIKLLSHEAPSAVIWMTMIFTAASSIHPLQILKLSKGDYDNVL